MRTVYAVKRSQDGHLNHLRLEASDLEVTLTYRLVVSSNGLLRCSKSMIDNAVGPQKFFVTSEAAGVLGQSQGLGRVGEPRIVSNAVENVIKIDVRQLWTHPKPCSARPRQKGSRMPSGVRDNSLG